MIVTKTFQLCDEGGGVVCAVDVEWLVTSQGADIMRLIGVDDIPARIRAHAREHMPPDDADIAGATWARMELAG